MYSDTTKELLDSIVELEDIRAGMIKDKEPKQIKTKLNYLFNQKTQEGIKDLAKLQISEGFSESEIARAAMMIGLKELEKAGDNGKHLRGLLHISRLRNKFQ